MKKVIIINIIVVVFIFIALEITSILWGRMEDAALLAPENAEQFADFESWLKYCTKEGNLERRLMGGHKRVFEPYTVSLLKPNYTFKIRNFNYCSNSLGLRSEEIATPKPANTRRIFILGGSTVEGGLNEYWTVAHYLSKKLKQSHENLEVINAGIAGFGSQNELALLQTRILDLQPDLVIIFDGRNDLYYSITPYWENRRGEDYFSQKRALDGLIDNPTFFTLTGNLARFIATKSSILTRAFDLVFRQKPPHVYPHEAKIQEKAVQTYVDNLRLIKAVLETEGINGIIAFQPTLGYGKQKLSPYEHSIADYLRKVEDTDWLTQVATTWPVVAKRVAALPQSGLVKTCDLSRLFENTTETAYIDSCHYVPLGNQMIGEKLAEIVDTEFNKVLGTAKRNN